MPDVIPNQDCPEELRLSAYHDGELPAADRADVDRHLLGCPPCRAYVADLGRTSAWLATAAAASVAGLSPLARARLHRRVDATLEQGLVRFGWRLSGLAAAVVLAGSAWMTWAAGAAAPAGTATVATLPPWVAVQAAAGADPVSASQPPATPAAAWYLADSTARD